LIGTIFIRKHASLIKVLYQLTLSFNLGYITEISY